MSARAVAWALDAPVSLERGQVRAGGVADACDERGAGVLNVSRLAIRVASERRAVQRRLAWLEAKGWIVRHPAPFARGLIALPLHAPQPARAAA